MYCNIIAMIDMNAKTKTGMKRRASGAPMEIRMTGYEAVEKVAKPCATSGRILVPVHWVGKRVKAVLVEK